MDWQTRILKHESIIDWKTRILLLTSKRVFSCTCKTSIIDYKPRLNSIPESCVKISYSIVSVKRDALRDTSSIFKTRVMYVTLLTLNGWSLVRTNKVRQWDKWRVNHCIGQFSVSHPPVLGHRVPVRTGGNELPVTHCSLSFLVSMTIVYCRINKFSTDNSSELWHKDYET